MTNGPLCFPLGVEDDAAGALIDDDVDFPTFWLQCLFPSQCDIVFQDSSESD